jgi:hypothetical protein
MFFNRFDILSAYYLFGSDYHSGQWSKEYAYMGRAMNAGFSPGAMFGLISLSENAREIYDALVDRYRASIGMLTRSESRKLLGLGAKEKATRIAQRAKGRKEVLDILSKVEEKLKAEVRGYRNGNL